MLDSKTVPPHADWMGLEQHQPMLNQSMILPVGVILSAYLGHEYII